MTCTARAFLSDHFIVQGLGGEPFDILLDLTDKLSPVADAILSKRFEDSPERIGEFVSTYYLEPSDPPTSFTKAYSEVVEIPFSKVLERPFPTHDNPDPQKTDKRAKGCKRVEGNILKLVF